MSRIGVIIPVYNSGTKLCTTIDSILVQTGSYELQVLIIDDFSSDETTKMTLWELGKHPLITVINNDRNIGICESRNKGLTLLSASTDYIMFVDHDDVLAPLAIHNFMTSFTQQSNAIAVMGIAYKFGPLVTNEENEQFIKSQLIRRNISFCNGRFDVSYKNVSQLTFPIILSSYTFHPPAKAMLRTDALIKSGVTFEKRFELVEDWIFWIKLLKYGDILAIEEVTAGYLWHQSNNSQRKDQVLRLKYAWWYLFWYSLQSRKYLTSYLITTGRNRVDTCDSYMTLPNMSNLIKLKYFYKSCITLFIRFILLLLLSSKTMR
jgi:glycosyltransferase involved in cell wall biosynthesis